MCGITGVLNIDNPQPIELDKLNAANATIYHRGPDDDGVYLESDFGMAMRRLSIIDVQGGQQPISSECGRFHICYNGEVYNYKELQNELRSAGFNFRTNSDTEVVLKAYMKWGADGSLKKLQGMFAYAIWDSHEKELFLARDRMGIKPLYYTEYNGRLFFASEMRGLLMHSNIPRQVDHSSLDAFLKVGFVTAPYSLFRGIKKLPPANYLFVKNGFITKHTYWELTYESDTHYSSSDYIDQFRSILAESVKIHLMSEVPLGSLLSGGIDSITNAALIQKHVQDSVKTICIGFNEKKFDEAARAERASQDLGTDHHSVFFDNNSLDEYPKALYFREEPTADATFAATYYLFKACQDHNLKVVLSGEGADELLGGYSWHRWEHWIQPFIGLPVAFRTLIANGLLSLSSREGIERMAVALKQEPTSIVNRYQDYISIGDDALRNVLYSPETRSIIKSNGSNPVLESWNEHLTPVKDQSSYNQLLWLQSRTRMVDWINHSMDRMSMAHSVEARPPFLDHRLWELTAAIPSDIKMGGNYLKPVEKHLLREAGRNLIPEEARLRKKQGLSVPHSAWLKQDRLPEWAEYMLSESQIKKMGLFDHRSVTQMHQEHRSGAPHRATFLMGVLAVQTWGYMFLECPLESGMPTF